MYKTTFSVHLTTTNYTSPFRIIIDGFVADKDTEEGDPVCLEPFTNKNRSLTRNH